jgi:predicted nucleic acid-binding protein
VVLVDSSIWIASFRLRPEYRVDDLVDIDEVVTCPPIVQEVLQGFREEFAFRRARGSMLALPIVESPMTIDLYQEAAQIYRAARRAGFPIRSGVDCLIAAAAIRHNLSLLHADRDFGAIAHVTPLRLHQRSHSTSGPVSRNPTQL